MPNTKELELLAKRRLNRLIHMVQCDRRDLAERLAKTKRLFKHRAWAVDIHTHSACSDGLGTVEQNYAAAMNAGLDFIFATDHLSLRQKRVTKKWANASWGQEPGAGAHHLGLLCNARRFKPKRDSFPADYERAKKLAPFVWVPHPTGWYPGMWYPDERIEQLWELEDGFAVEVMNGAHKIVRAYDRFDQKAVGVWDRLLCDGRKVTAVAGSDAHGPDDIGSCWTGVLIRECTAGAIIKALNAGRCFGSEASLLQFTCDGRPMGSTLRRAKGSALRLRLRVADAAGLATVRLISMGKTIREWSVRGRPLMDAEVTRKFAGKPVYYRLESTAVDDRRAFSTPIYVERAP